MSKLSKSNNTIEFCVDKTCVRASGDTGTIVTVGVGIAFFTWLFSNPK